MSELKEGMDALAKKRKEYPDDYKGPMSGHSSNEEWVAVRDYDAYKYVRDGVWSYSDFDCYLYCMCQEFYKKGGDAVHDAFKAMHEVCGIKDQP